ncbi:MAG: hypothetical protein E6Q83_16525 [Thiothrix sp.]|nr:MAG: hypothetical protein E6Q83_16525 [Thiothrix sp.]
MLSHANCGACGVPSGCRSFLSLLLFRCVLSIFSIS